MANRPGYPSCEIAWRGALGNETLGVAGEEADGAEGVEEEFVAWAETAGCDCCCCVQLSPFFG